MVRAAMAQTTWWGFDRPARAVTTRGHRGVLVAILAACVVLRLALYALVPNIHYADEIYQVAEPANRAAHGYGIISWEFQTASRPAILATLVGPIFHVNASAAAH